MRRRLVRISLFLIGGIVLILTGLYLYLLAVATVDPPQPENPEALTWTRQHPDSGVYTLNKSWLRKSESGLYEMRIDGAPFERGVIVGKLTKELARYQEEVFTKQIHALVPSNFYLGMLRYFVGWFNRDLDDSVPEEFAQEILGVSSEASPEFDDIAPPYQRILNYHAAHDIGHALQNMSLVGCTSFAVWGDKSADGKLLIGRNFDFYVGDDFAKNKIIAFYHPSQGHRFMMVTFAGMTGVLSGMNEAGLTVTINAAKSEIPSGSATPVSIVAREILQYASTIDEAYAIAQKRNMFVAESFLIGSASEHKAGIIEKSPQDTDLVTTDSTTIICTNHFQGDKLGSTTLNQEHIRTSASMYRWEKVRELLKANQKMTVPAAAILLRNQQGLYGKDIGLGNEKAVNQLIAHHSIIFQPADLKVWVSTQPWQMGKYVCYDLKKIFADSVDLRKEIYESALTIPADTFLATASYHEFVKFAKYRFPFQPRDDMQPDSIVKWNPDSYLACMLAGDASMKRKNFDDALKFYQLGLTKEVATLQERDYMTKQSEKCKQLIQ